jgi:hypothetical protein
LRWLKEWGKEEDFLLQQVTPMFTPPALVRKPELCAFEIRLLNAFVAIDAMRVQTLSGVAAITLRELQIYLDRYPQDDELYFIDVMTEIDREARSGNNPDRKN